MRRKSSAPLIIEPVPPQPPESTWTFVKDLQTPLHQPIRWPKRAPARDEVFIGNGLRLIPEFADPHGLLTTACDDFRFFLKQTGQNIAGPYPVITRSKAIPLTEAYEICVRDQQTEILAADTEGIRRGLIYIEDEMLRRGGPFLPRGIIRRKPVIRSRISRCFYGPINRPPKNRDELADDVNYYPDEYLNRLAHDGINGLWLTIAFKDTVPSNIIPEYGKNAARRLAKLRQTVARCARYGVKIYVFCIEPASFSTDSPVLAAHPELGGQRALGSVAFCPCSAKGQAYLEEATHTLFFEVPGLGGLIDITVGERFTNCYSAAATDINCPRCSRKKPWETLALMLNAMERGMHAANPRAELISWPYSQYASWGPELTAKAAGHLPSNVILQHNFESNGRNRQLGKWRTANDYWLSYVGPSRLFSDCARAATAHGNRMFAKLQVACSHEVATAPFIPVPGILYEKYKAMHRLGVSGAMQCWYFGNYPSIMTKAAGELSFAPFPKSRAAFLLDMARREWGRRARQVVRAWQFFQAGYTQFPTSAMFGYYGPMHDGPAWPLFLEPRHAPLAPTWLINHPPSGDRIGEAITDTHTLAETLTLCRRMAACWNRGLRILKRLAPDFRRNPERLADIRVAAALGLQFRSGYNIIRFYALRKELEVPGRRGGLRLLIEMARLIRNELAIDRELLALANADSRLGFHSEAEGYKYYPAKIKWRMHQLRHVLKTEFPVVRRRLRRGSPAFPVPSGDPAYRCRRMAKAPTMNGQPSGGVWEQLETAQCLSWTLQRAYPYDGHFQPLDDRYKMGRRTSWKAGFTRQALYFGIVCEEADMAGLRLCPDNIRKFSHYETKTRLVRYDILRLNLEAQTLWPSTYFIVTPDGKQKYWAYAGVRENEYRWQAATGSSPTGWSAIIRIPFATLGIRRFRRAPMRINIERLIPLDIPGQAFNAWVERQANPRYRLGLEALSFADFGWLLFDPQ